MEKTESWPRRELPDNPNNQWLILSWNAFSCCSCLRGLRRFILQFSTASGWLFPGKFGSKCLSTDLTALCCITLCQCSEIHLTYIYIIDIRIYKYKYSLSSFCLRLCVFSFSLSLTFFSRFLFFINNFFFFLVYS